MFEIILLAYLSFRNGVRAKLKGLNSVAWALYTAIAFFFMMFFGTFIVIVYFCRDVVDIRSFSTLDMKSRDAAMLQLQQVIVTHPLHYATIALFGIGGYLLVRYLIERKPGKKKPELVQNID
jgi:hypothetical protein